MTEEELDSIVGSLISSFPDFDEHIVRLHLLAYSVWDYIIATKLNYLLLMQISRGFEGLLRVPFLHELREIDPLQLREGTHEPQELRALVRFQVESFVQKPRDPLFETGSFRELLLELAFTDSEAVRRWEDEADERARIEQSAEKPFLDLLKKYMTSIMIEFPEGWMVVDPEKMTSASYRRYADYLITEFYQNMAYSPPSAVHRLVADRIEIRDSYQEILFLNCGIGAGIAQLDAEAIRDKVGIRANAQFPCERLLCGLNLWSLEDRIGEIFVDSAQNTFEDVKDEIASELRNNSKSARPAIIVAYVSVRDIVDPGDIDRRLFSLSYGTANPETAYVEALLKTISDNGRLMLLLPSRFLNSEDSRILREHLVTRDHIVSVTQVPPEMWSNSFSEMSILSIDLEKSPNDVGKIEFRISDKHVSQSLVRIRDNNPDLDLRPSRFLDTVEYKHQAIFDLFTSNVLAEGLRPSLIEILDALYNQTTHKHLFNPARKLLEAVYDNLISGEVNPPEDLLRKNERLEVENCWLYFSGREVKMYRDDPRPIKRKRVFPPHVEQSAKTCQGLGNAGSHYYKGEGSRASFNSAVYALLDVLEWFAQWQRQRDSGQ